MALNTEQVQKVCNDLVNVLKQLLADQDPELVALIGQQYFMGTLSRLVSLSKLIEEKGTEAPDLNLQDLHFSITYPEEVDLAQIETIRQEAAILLAKCLKTLEGDLN